MSNNVNRNDVKKTATVGTDPINLRNASRVSSLATAGAVAGTASGVVAEKLTKTGDWVGTGLKDFGSKIKQEFIGANLYLIGFLIVLFLGIAFYVYYYYVAPLFSKGYVANKEISKNGVDGTGRDEDDTWNMNDDDGAAFDFSLLDKGLKFNDLATGVIKDGLMLIQRDDIIMEPKYPKLHSAVENNDKEAVTKIFKKIQKKLINEEVNGWTALDIGLTLPLKRKKKNQEMSNEEKRINTEITDLLINYGSEPNIAIHWIIKQDNITYLKKTLNYLNSKNIPVDINSELPNKWTPMDVAMEMDVQNSGAENFATMKEGMANPSEMINFLNSMGGKNNALHVKPEAVPKKGNLTIRFFYTTWCPYSTKAAPEFDKLINKYNNTGKLVNGYSINCIKINGESEARMQKEFEYKYLKDSNHKKEIDAYPTIYLVKDNAEVYEFEAQPRFDVFEDFIRQVAYGYGS